MNLAHDIMYQVKPGHRFHANRFGRFKFLGGPNRDVIVMSDLRNENHLFAIGLDDLVDFRPHLGDQVHELTHS